MPSKRWPTPQPEVHREPLRETWLRRAITFPLYFLMFALWSAALLPLIVIAIPVDLLRQKQFVMLRAVLFFELYLICEIVGIISSFTLWLVAGPWTGRENTSWIHANRALQYRWGRALGGGAFAIFGIRVSVDADERFGTRPILLMIRHASTADTILAVNFISIPYNLPLRYVLKRELLWDPSLDIVGNRIPNVFVDRKSRTPAAEIESVGQLLVGLEPSEGVLIYPEGTRFSVAKRERIAEKFEKAGDLDSAAFTRSLQSVLPPRSAGPSVLLERNPGLDIVICAHSGFEGSASFADFWNGKLVGSHVQIRLRSFAPDQIPTDSAERTEWLRERWREVDAFVSSPPPTG
ncbi:MAG: 1-acyl-sn-glycerol-3-phosphate acyltransferase [Hyphomicrobiaceae bacterium]|jgi:1-acyl-sn-glycerol-3-phosphate acyltransferase